MTLLLLRGAQTPGELRSRAGRMYEFNDVSQVESTLETLASREDGPFVTRLSREPGKRESRYRHLFCGGVEITAAAEETLTPQPAFLAARVDQLEAEVAELKERLDLLLAHLGE